MSTRLLTQEGKNYPSTKVFVDGILDKSALAKYGLPRLTGTFAYAMFMANAAVSHRRLKLSLFADDTDWCTDCPHHFVLGWRCSQIIQASQSRKIRRSPSRAYAQAL